MDEDMTPKITYLRMSITDRCQLRCFYCTYWQDWEKLPSKEILSYEELLRIAAVAAEAGVRKIRVTGGEPLIRRGMVSFIQRLHQVPGIREVCLTTNGVLLKELALPLYEAGLRHLNLSLDTLRRGRYQRITGSDNLPEVMAGLERAASLGFHPLKINCVVLKGINDDELLDLALLARDHPYQVRFIELMPTISREQWHRHFLSIKEVHRRLEALGPQTPVAQTATAGPARIFRYPGFLGEVGFISPMSKHNCGSCNRLRLTAAGKLRPCLLETLELDLKSMLGQGLSDASLTDLFHEAIRRKNDRFGFPSVTHFPFSNSMASIGG